ncbi:MAG: hypothetical protein PHG23_01800 [Candidatus Pacebacteria bacterium]|nr:hypothetical protein [Candidatus Paceibacterota bacterium]
MFENLLINNVEQARNAYNGLTGCCSARPKRRIIQRWNKLVLPGLQKVIDEKNVDGLLVMLPDIPPDGDLKNMVESALKEFGLSRIFTASQAKNLYNELDGKACGFVGATIKNRWNTLSLAELEQADSFPMIGAVADNAFPGGDVFVKAVEKWANACQTLDETNQIFVFLREKKYKTSRDRDTDQKLNYFPEKRRDEILLYEIPKISDVKTLKEYFDIASKESAARLLAFEKWLRSCKTPQEANEAFQAAQSMKGNACLINAYKRIKNLTIENT